MGNPKISIVIPAHNEEKSLRACLAAALSSAAASPDLGEVIVVDNASTDKTRDIASSFVGVKIVSESALGVMRARQKGYRESRGEIVAFLDADNIVPKDWARKIIEIFGDDSSLSCISGPYSYYDMRGWQKPLASIYWQIIVPSVARILGYVGNFGNMALRRSVLDKMGGLDTSIAFYGDDTATAREASRYGKVRFVRLLMVQSSARRFAKQGLFRTTFIYAANFFSQAIFKKSLTKSHTAHR